MATYLIINGRPGSGKSTLARRIARLYGGKRNVAVLNDHPILRDMFEQEERGIVLGQRQFRRREQGGTVGFDVLNRQVFRIALCLLNEHAHRYLLETRLVLIEFARNNYTDIWNCLGPDIRRNAHCFFLQTPLEACIQRVYARAEKPRYADDTFVSEEALRKNHQDDGLLSLQNTCKPGQLSVLNNQGAWADTWVEAKTYLDTLFSRAAVPAM